MLDDIRFRRGPIHRVSAATLVYSGIALRWFVHRRAQFPAVLQSSQSGLTTTHYLRLIALSMSMMLFTTAIAIFILAITLNEGGLRPWISWEDVHSNWFRIAQYAHITIPQSFWDITLVIWYIVPVTSVIFFAFFGFGQEAKVEYVKAIRWVQRTIFRVKLKQRPVLPVSCVPPFYTCALICS
jgi:pheromone a factor receptor